MRFEPNLGQTDPESLFLARGNGYALFLTATGAVLSLPSTATATTTSTTSATGVPPALPTVLSMNLVGASTNAMVTGTDELTGKSNYLNSNDPSKWLTNVPNYGQVSYQNVYAGIGLTYYGDGQQLEYDFTVAPGADPAAIKLAFQGTEHVSVDGQGNLVLHTAAGDVVQQAPVIYQVTGGQRQTVSGGYVVGDNGQVGFTLGSYDHTRPLVIDPVLAYSTYLGQDGTNLGFASAHAVAADKQGDAYVTGSISTDQFPLLPDGQAFNGEGKDVFVTKLDPSGQIVFSTYFGGQPSENGVHLDPDLLAQGIEQKIGWQYVDNVGYGIAVHDDGKGNDSIYVTGQTSLNSFFNISQDIGFSPIVNAFQPEFGGGAGVSGGTNAFVAELLPDGTGFAYSSYLGGHTNSFGNAITVDAAGNAYVAGSSTSFFSEPVATQAFVARINANGTLAWDNAYGSSTYGNATDGNAIALDNSGNLFIAGETNDPGFATQTPVAESLGGLDAYVAKLSPTDGTLLATARLGGNYPLTPDEGDDYGSGIAVDGAGDVYITGTTFIANFPTTTGALKTTRPESLNLATAFVAKLSSDLTKLLYSTYLGGDQGVTFVDNAGNTAPTGSGDFGHAIAVDAGGDAYVVGSTSSADFPTVDALQTQHVPLPHEFPDYTIAGLADAFVAELDPSGSGLYFSTYLGGSSNDVAEGVALDSADSVYVVGTTDSTDFPTTDGAAQTTFSRPEGGINYNQFSDANYFPSFVPITSAFVARLSPPLKVTALPVAAYLNELFQGAVATFNSFDPSETAADLSAKIDWGDNTTSDGTITRAGGADGSFTVRGNHTYTQLGAYPISVVVHDSKRNLDASSASLVGSFGATYQADPTILTDPSQANKLVLVGGSEDLTGGSTSLLVGTSDTTSPEWSLSELATGTDELPEAAGIAKTAVDPNGDIFVLYATVATPSKLALIESTNGGDSFELVTDDYAKGQGEVSGYAIGAGTGAGGNGSRLWVAYIVSKTLLIDDYTVSDGEIKPDRSFQVASTNDGDPVLGDMAVGADGQVAVAFQSLGADGESKIYVAAIPFDLASTQSLSPVPVPSATQIVPDMPIHPVAGGINAGLRLAWDKSDGPGNPGTLYMVYTQGHTGSQDTNIVLGSSTDDGESWSGFQTVNDDSRTVGVSHFYPSLAVDPTTGDVAIGWYDARNDLTNDQQTVFETAVYDPNTEHISANVAATGFTSNATAPNLDPVSQKNEYGDYTSVAFDNGLVHLVWADNSADLRSAQSPVPFNLASATLAVADVSVAPPVVTGNAIDIAEGALVSQTIATFTDGDTSLKSSDFTATIDWGDGTSPTAGIITPVPESSGSFEVESTHHYAVAGAYVLGITVKDTVNMLVGTTDENVSRLPGYQGQGTVTVDPKHPNELFAVSDAESGFFAARSIDGGLTWTGRALADGSDDLPAGESDPKAVFDTFGDLFLSYLTENGSSVVVAYSADGGDSFSVLKEFATASGADRVALAVGPSANGEESVWIAYVDGDQKVYVTGAEIAGFSGTGDFAQPVLVPTPVALNEFHYADLAVGPNGEVAVSYLATIDPTLPSRVYVSVDPGGLNQPDFGPAVLVTSSNLGSEMSIPAQATAMIDVEPHLAWDTANDVHKGRLYLVYTDAAAIDNPDTNIFVRYSDDGKTWSPPVQVNDDKTPASHFLPSIAIDPTDGDVAVAWYDTRNDPAGIATRFYASVSNNGGMSFSSNVPVSDGPSNATDPALDEFSQNAQYGDYSDVAFFDGILIPAWTDNSPALGHNPDPPQFEQAVGFSPTAHVADVPLVGKALTLTAGAITKGVAAPVDLASFTDADPGANLALYSATIDWGDQTTATTGSVRASNGTFIVSGGHAYQAEGAFTINVTINDIGGAVTKVALQVQVDDGTLVPTGLSLSVGAGGTASSEVAHFTSSDPHAVPRDFATAINWGDGTTTAGQVVYDGTAALTWTPDYGLLTIGNQSGGANAGFPFLMQVGSDTQGGTNGPYPLMQLTADFHGGVAEGPNFQIYAISSNDAGESFLNLLTPVFPATSSTTRQVGYLGLGFTGGLTYDFADGVFYAIAQQNGTATLYAIDPQTFAVHSVGSLGSLSFAGLAYDPLSQFLHPPADVLYAVANDTTGASTLYKISLGTTLGVTSVMALGSGFTGGLAISGGVERFFAVSSDGTGAAFLNEVHLPSSVSQLRELGAQFNNGFDVLGTHSYSTNAAFTIRVQIKDVHGATVNTQATAQSVDQPPIGLPPPQPFTAFQNFATGALTLAEFTVPGGAGIATNHYTATVNWGDGRPSEPAMVTLAAGQLVVTSSGHTFQTAGTTSPTITLTDDSGNTASVTDTVDVLPDVTAEAKVVGLGGPVNASSGLITSAGTVTNIGGTTLKGPLYLIVKNLPSGVTLADADGTLASGQPYRLLQVSQLSPGQSANETLQFNDPSLTPFTYSVTVIDGPFGTPTPAGATPAMGNAGRGFVANVGQTDPRVQFVSQGAGYSLLLTSQEAVLALTPTRSVSEGGPPPTLADASGLYTTAPTAVVLSLIGANASVVPVGLDPLSGKANYLFGNDPSKWETGATSYARVEYRDVYPGITLDYHTSASNRLEYDFTVVAGADPNVIRLAIQGAESVAIDAAGNLVLHTADGDVVEQAPVLYQQAGGTRRAVAGGYVIEPDGSVGFRVGPYDANLPLVIDPVLAFSTYLGGSSSDQGNSIAVDADGNVYVTGQTTSLDFPTLGGLGSPPDRLGEPSGGTVAFVTKYDPTGALVYSTYFGGSGEVNFVGGIFGDFGNAIAVDAAREAVVVGKTYSADFPLVNALPSQPSNGASAFVAKLNAAGTGFVFSTFIQGSFAGTGVALDPTGNIYVAGSAEIGLPQAYSFRTTPGAASSSASNSFIEKLSPAGSSVLYATYVPGTEITNVPEVSGAPTQIPAGTVNALAVDSAGNAYMTGTAYDERYQNPAAPPPSGSVLHAAQSTFGGGEFDAFVAKLNTTGTALDYWTYLGGNDNDVGNAIAVDSTGATYVAGTTMSTNLATVNAVQGAFGGLGLDANNVDNLRGQGLVAGDAFVAKLNPDGSSFAYLTYLGGSGPDVGTGIAIDSAHNAYLTGQAGSADFPITHALQPTFGGDEAAQTLVPYIYGQLGEGDAFLARINANGGTLDYSTFLGGSGTDRGNAVAVTPGGSAFVTGFTTSSDFPTLNAAQPQTGLIQNVFSEQSTAFVARIDAQGAGVIRVTSVAFAATESVAFSGVVASFTDSDADTAANYSATIDWGDGTTSLGSVTPNKSSGFNVNGTHTYAEDGKFPVVVTVHDADGSVASASDSSLSLRERVGARAANYQVSVDTSSLVGKAGFLDFQFNPGALPGAQAADVIISQFQDGGGSLGGATLAGGASGSLTGIGQLTNSSVLNELKQATTFGSTLSFDVTLEGDALNIPLDGLFGSMLSLTLLAADGVTPLQAAAADGTALEIAVSPTGDVALVGPANNPAVHVTVATTISVADAPLQAALVPIQAIEAVAFGGTVATFVDPNSTAPVTDFTSSILWGDGTAASTGTIVADGGGRFHVTGSHTFAEAGNYAIQVVVLDKGGSQTIATASSVAPTAQITGLQAPRSAYEGGSLSMASGDLRHDGKLDLVVARYVPGTLQTELLILLGNGDGSFQSPLHLAIPASDTLNAFSPVIADFNGDGKPDIAAAGMVFLGNGDGTFQAGVPFDAGTFPVVAQAAGDLNGDGKLDLVVAGGAGIGGSPVGVRVLIGNGDGTFQNAVTYGAETGQTVSQLFVRNFHGNGNPDIVFSTTAGDTWLLPNLGDGTFGTATLIASGLSVAAVGDLKANGKLDLVAFDGTPLSPGTHVAVLMGNGDGTFQTPVSYAVGLSLMLATVGDFSGDGKPDIAVADEGTSVEGGTFGAAIHLLRNDGDGTFAAPVSYATQPAEVGNLLTGDFNGDGNLDLAMENNSSGLNGSPASISILLGRGDGTFVDGPFTPTGNSVNSIATADFNGDGHSDVALTGGVPGVEVLNGNGDGTYQSARVFATPDATQTGSNLLSADFNGDGRPDLVTGTLLFAGNGNGTYQPATSWNTAGVKAIATGDFMGDGHSDLVGYTYNNTNDTTAVSLWLNDGHGAFHTSWSYTVPGIAAPPVVANFNGDGKPDLAIAVGDKGEVLVFINNGDGTFKAPLTDTIASSFLEATTVGDFRGDGKEDLAVAAQGGVYVLLGNGDGTFRTAVNVYPTAAGIYSISTGDFNRDGKADLLLTTQPNTTEVVTVLISNGDGTFRTGQSIDTALNSVSGAIVADLNGDGKLDFAVAGEAVHVYLGNGDGTFLAGPVYATGNLAGEAFLTLAAADVTGNGRVDLLTMATGFGASGATFGILLGQPDGTLRAGRVYGSGGELGTPLGPQAIDVNHDGNPDLVAIEATSSGSQDALVLLNNGDGTFQAKDYDLRTAAQQQQGLRIQVTAFTVGDFNGDGIPDIVADVSDSNFNSSRVLLVGNGDGTFQAPRDLPLVNSYSPTILQAVDINGDGKLDLVTFGEIPFNRQVFVQVEIGDGKGGFQAPIVTGPLANVDLFSTATTAANAFALGDFNGDGKLDVAVGATDGSVEMLPGNGDGTFQAPVNSPLGMPATQFVAGDLDSNGKADLLAVDAAGVVALLRGNSDGTFQQPLRYSTSLTVGQLTSNNDFVSLADVNGDGVSDVVIGTAFGIATIINQRSQTAENVADAPLIVAGQNSRAVQGATFFGSVARFTDANPRGTASDFAATITWGDGAHSVGTIDADPNGGFDVLGTHVYTSAGTVNVSVAIADEDGSTAAASSAIAVIAAPDATLSATGDTIGETAGVAFSGVVATFTDSDPAGTPSDFTALIDWGDGHKSLGAVKTGAGGVFQVVGANTYAQAATYQVAVSIFDGGGAAATAASTADVATNNNSPLADNGVTMQAVEQVAFSGTVATFTDSGPGRQATDYMAIIDWGDGQTSAGAVAADTQVIGRFDVVATHTYAEEGVYAVTLQVSRSGASATANSTVDVADASLVVSGSPVSAVEATTFAGVVASFSDANPFGTLADYSAAIDWGDGHTSTGQVSADPSAFDRFDVTGTNTYAEAGRYVVSVTVTDRGGSTDTVRLPASVADAPITATGTTISTTIGAAFTGVVVTFSDQNSASTATDFIATILWGDGDSTTGSIAPAAGGGFEVSGTHTYSSAGTLPVAVTILDEGGGIERAAASAVVTGPTLQASAVTIQPTEGLAFAGTVATFSVTVGNAEASDFAAAINWGNGQTTAATITYDAGKNQFDVLGIMTYAEEGSYTVGVSIGDRDGTATSLSSTAVVADTSLSATALPLAASKGVPFSAVVAHFTDANPVAKSGDFTAKIIWGDGQTSTGTIGVDPTVAGQFDVTGSVTYQTNGSLPLAVNITDKGGASAAATATAAVEVLPTASGTTLQEQATVTFSAAVAVIDDANPGDQPSDFAATITWGDGQTSTGLVTYDPTDKTHFQVLGNSAYTNAGTYTLSVALARSDGLKLNVTGSVSVSAAPGGPLTTLPTIAVSATQGVAVKAVVGMFSDADPTATPSDYTATINWGDGSSSTGSVVAVGTQGTFGVVGQHTYASSGTDFVTVDINDAKGAKLQAANRVQIAPSVGVETISGAGLSFSGHELSPLVNVAIATFTITNGLPDPSALSATINWGDGTTSAGGVSLSGKTYTVTGVHTYGDEGHFTATVSVTENNASPAVSATIIAQATIHEQPLAEGTTGTPNQSYIQEIYRDLFARLAEPQGRDYWVGKLLQGVPREQVAYEIVKVASFEEFQYDTVASLYQQYLGRQPDEGGRAYWAAYLYDGGTIEGMSQALVSSPEYFHVRGDGTVTGFLNAAFRDALGRQIDSAALIYFERLMANGTSAAGVATAIFNSDEYHRLRISSFFEQLLDRPADPSALAYFANELDTGDRDEIVLSQLISSDEYYEHAQL